MKRSLFVSGTIVLILFGGGYLLLLNFAEFRFEPTPEELAQEVITAAFDAVDEYIGTHAQLFATNGCVEIKSIANKLNSSYRIYELTSFIPPGGLRYYISTDPDSKSYVVRVAPLYVSRFLERDVDGLELGCDCADPAYCAVSGSHDN